MAKATHLSADLKADIERVGIGSILTWLSENKITIDKGNFFDALESGLENGTITDQQLKNAIAEIAIRKFIFKRPAISRF